MKRLYLLLALLASAIAQTPTQNINPCIQAACFWATQSATVSASGAITLTVAQPATGTRRQISFLQAIVQCPGQSFTVDQAQNGTVTTTAGTATALLPIQYVNGGTTAVTAAAKVFTSSNVSGATAVSPTQTYSSGSVPVLDLSQRTMGIPPTGSFNYSVTLTNTGSGNCTGTIGIYWLEKI
jgi:hypothetical protein